MRSLGRRIENQSDVLARLADAVEAVATPHGTLNTSDPVLTGWDELDQGIGGLRRGVLHEWLVEPWPHRGLIAPFSLLTHLATRSVTAAAEGGLLVWVGKTCCPYARTLSASVLARSIYLEPRDRAERVWTLDVALRSRAVGVIIGDGSGLGMGESRRLQVAAASGGTLCLLARPMKERRTISAAWTRWRVHPAPTDTSSPGWALELLRCKGVQPGTWEARRWVVQRAYETGHVSVVSDAGDRPDEAARSASRASG